MLNVRARLMTLASGLVAATGPAAAQCEPWTLGASVGPSPRQNHAMAYDGGVVMLFGGFRAGFGFNAETWTWDGEAWSQSAGAGPSARGNFAMALDSSIGCVILFGGAGGTGSTFFGDTWSWDGGAWVDVTPAGTSPSARFNHAMAYDAQSDRAVMFGGFNTVRLSDTWVYDAGGGGGTGSGWTQVFPATVPPARSSHAMVYDSARDRVVMFGGFLGGGQWSNQTWEWDGSNWTLSLAVGPAGRQYLGMVYDPERQVTVLSCGQAANFVRLDDTWEYDGTQWTQVTTMGSPAPARDQHAMAYYPGGTVGGGAVLLHGGYAGAANVLSDTWTLACEVTCYADCNTDGSLTIADFGCFQAAFVAGQPYADCNGTGSFTIADFACFQTAFVAGCP